ncbi:MAG: 2-oxoacid:ferredoxin oxidoreductase subunit beta [Candidatus Heimdallarchaeota archaeon]|nr:MAG: 2-oxoacid:ferredoxin oxidoreductase subunit beta [Candidatus Heimdallarchaeota archaeon]
MTTIDEIPAPKSTDEIPEDHPLHERLNLHRFIFCPGCLIGSAITSITSCFVERGLTSKDYAVVSGIGCTGRSSGCFNSPAFHTTHGRAIPFATGLKLANPKLEVVVLSGDGDLFAIGGNHFIHACRRNIEITVLCINNNVYGMTGGQCAPTTQIGDLTTTTPYGNIEPPFNLVSLAAASGASYVARWPGYDTLRLRNSILKAFDNPGFSFIEVLAPCFTQYGRKNKLGDAVQMLDWIKNQVRIIPNCPPHEAEFDFKKGRIVCGEFVDAPREGFSQKIQQLRDMAQKKK